MAVVVGQSVTFEGVERLDGRTTRPASSRSRRICPTSAFNRTDAESTAEVYGAFYGVLRAVSGEGAANVVCSRPVTAAEKNIFTLRDFGSTPPRGRFVYALFKHLPPCSALRFSCFSALGFEKRDTHETLDFIERNALLGGVEIRGVGPLTFSMPLRR